MLTARPEIAGVAFTGSTDTARAINRALAMRDGPIATLIAETGGQNAMIVDSSALPNRSPAMSSPAPSRARASAVRRCACSTCRTMFTMACWR
jgi:RHH-type proline utilization regulon transcriptional repressor/proline dehydrogenase/delta 1-pyrroline-5-carboxylate dehydrogenase